MIDSLILIPEITKGMKSIGSKSLLKIKNIPILEHQINEILNINGDIRLNIATGFDHDRISKHISSKYSDIRFIYNELYSTTNQMKALALYLENSACDNLLIINSGILLKNKEIQFSTLSGNSKIYLLNKPRTNFNIGCSVGGPTEYLFYDLPNIWSECVYLNKETIRSLKEIIQTKNIDQFYLFEIINTLILQNIHFEKVIIDKKNIFKINHAKDLMKARQFI
jgi:bifunctional N-acetylglucosamine-1-phosphate-uridyltransferase/glucosamine-1-phosphate-acetyltransferase GlmU-like protein